MKGVPHDDLSFVAGLHQPLHSARHRQRKWFRDRCGSAEPSTYRLRLWMLDPPAGSRIMTTCLVCLVAGAPVGGTKRGYLLDSPPWVVTRSAARCTVLRFCRFSSSHGGLLQN